MRLLKVLFAALLVAAALFAGVVVVAAIALAGLLTFLGRRLLRRATHALPGPEARERVPSRPPAPEVIDVAATEIPERLSHEMNRPQP